MRHRGPRRGSRMPYDAPIDAAATAHRLDPALVKAVVMQESGGKFYAYRYEPDFWTRYLQHNAAWMARSPMEVSASYGLMQILYVTAVEEGFRGQPWELFAPSVALDCGCRHLAGLLAWARGLCFGQAQEPLVTRCALAAYNGGKAGNTPTDSPLRNSAYADEVYARYQRLLAGKDA